jgi:hypothetical protein
MKKMWIVALVVLLLVVAASYGISRSASTAGGLEPAAVVREFYGWYLEYIGDRGTDGMRNPLVDGAYRTSPHLAPEFVREVDELIAGFEGGGFDPFLLAQDIPTEIKVGEAKITGRAALVPVTTSFAGHHITVTLEQVTAGTWQITAITPRR